MKGEGLMVMERQIVRAIGLWCWCKGVDGAGAGGGGDDDDVVWICG